jgi:hypothetical protein
VEKHIRIGIDSLREIMDEKKSVKHLRFIWAYWGIWSLTVIASFGTTFRYFFIR